MRTVTLWNGRQVDRRLLWWVTGRIAGREVMRLAVRLGLKVFTLRPGGQSAGAAVALAEEWARQAGAPPITRERP